MTRDPHDTAWDFLLQRLERLTTKQETQVLLIHDEGDALAVRTLARHARRAGIAGSAFGSGFVRTPFRGLVDDPVSRSSQQSYFLQLADLNASALARIDPGLLARNGPRKWQPSAGVLRATLLRSCSPIARIMISPGRLRGPLSGWAACSAAWTAALRFGSRCSRTVRISGVGARQPNCEHVDVLCYQHFMGSLFLPIRKIFSLSLNLCKDNQQSTDSHTAETSTSVM